MLSLAGALSYAELVAAMPQAGGEYVFLRRAYGPLWGYLYGWEAFVIGKTGSIATIATAFAVFLGYFFSALHEEMLRLPLGFATWSLTGAQVISLSAIIGLTVINYLGVILGGAVQTVFTVLKVAIILTLAALAFALGHAAPSAFEPFLAAPKGVGTFSAFGVALVAALWAYDGWNNLTMVGEEVRDPERNIPRALIFGTLGVMLVYLFVNAAYFYILPLATVQGTERVAQEMARSFLGEWGGIIITLGALISTFATLNAAILSGARIPYAMARDRLFFRFMAQVHPLQPHPGQGATVAGGLFLRADPDLRKQPRRLRQALHLYHLRALAFLRHDHRFGLRPPPQAARPTAPLPHAGLPLGAGCLRGGGCGFHSQHCIQQPDGNRAGFAVHGGRAAALLVLAPPRSHAELTDD